jgi:hypothetical protein
VFCEYSHCAILLVVNHKDGHGAFISNPGQLHFARGTSVLTILPNASAKLRQLRHVGRDPLHSGRLI